MFFLMNCHWIKKKYACRFFKMSRFVNHFSFWGHFFPLFPSFSMLFFTRNVQTSEISDGHFLGSEILDCVLRYVYVPLCFFQRSVTPTRKCIQRFGWSQRRRPTRPHQQKSSARAQPQRNPKSKTSSMSGLEVSGYFYWTRSTSSKSSRS